VSFRPDPIDPVPDETVRVARAAVPKGSRYLQMRDALGTTLADAGFAALYPARGRPVEAPWRLALVTVMRFAGGLSDRRAAGAVRARVDWKYALGPDLTDPGFGFSVLSECRTRLIAGSAEHLLLDRLLAARTDEAPAWAQRRVPAAWRERYGRRIEEYRLPRGQAERHASIATVGDDGPALLAALGAPQMPSAWRELPAVAPLRRVWGQQFDAATGRARRRGPKEWPPATDHIETPRDAEARDGLKRGVAWTGDKVHATETCDDDRPHLITDVATPLAPEADAEQLASIEEDLAHKDLTPAQDLVDAGDVRGRNLVGSRERPGIDPIGPVAADHQWQAGQGRGRV
jgi:transposase